MELIKLQVAKAEAMMSSTDTPDYILSWLEGVDVELDADLEREHPREVEKEAPRTPTRHRLKAIVEAEEFSPTNTNFSDGSIFDKPEKESLLRPSKFRPDVDDDSISDITDATLVENDEDDGQKVKQEHSQIQEEPVILDKDADSQEKDVDIQEKDFDSLDAESLNSYEPTLSDIPANYPSSFTAISALPVIDRTTPRLVRIYSCLQCTVAGLRCSRTPPACSRCVRAGCADVCLMQRRKLVEEMEGGWGNGLPILLRVRGEGEEGWERKRSVYEEIFEQLREKADRDNWILPRVDSPRGIYAGRGKVRYRSLHPEAGDGPTVHRVLHLA